MSMSIKGYLLRLLAVTMVAMFCISIVSCGDDDKDSVDTTFFASLETPYGTRLNGCVYVFPNASDYAPETFKIGEGSLGLSVKATISRKDGTIVNSYAYLMCSTKELGVWHHYDREPNDPWLHSCNPGTYYMIATRTGWGTFAWMSKTVTIKANNGNLEKFIFTTTNGYQQE